MSNTEQNKTELKLKYPLLDFKKGEVLTFDPKWCVWTRKATGETYDLRGSIGEGEIVMLLCYCKETLSTVFEQLQSNISKEEEK